MGIVLPHPGMLPDAYPLPLSVSITGKEADTALDAFARYGKGRGHPAQLNMADCFAYAAAKNYRAALLFKGEDFTKTDIRPALPPA